MFKIEKAITRIRPMTRPIGVCLLSIYLTVVLGAFTFKFWTFVDFFSVLSHLLTENMQRKTKAEIKKWPFFVLSEINSFSSRPCSFKWLFDGNLYSSSRLYGYRTMQNADMFTSFSRFSIISPFILRFEIYLISKM